MSNSTLAMKVLETHKIPFLSGLDRNNARGGWIDSTQYAWFTNEANLYLYSTKTKCVEYSRSFSDIQTNKSLKITFVKELHNSKKINNLLLVGCSFKSSGILFICLLPKLTTICCIALPSPVSFISKILNKSLPNNQLSNELKQMSTILLVGMATGEVYAIDLKEHYIKNQLEKNKIDVNELKLNKLFIIKKNCDYQKVEQMSNDNDYHLAMLINENFCTYYRKKYSDKLDFSVSSLLFNENINAVAIGYSTGHLQLWDCTLMQSICELKKPIYDMPITHFHFLEPPVDPKNICYLWVIQSNNSELPNAMMIALNYEQKIMMSNGCWLYKVNKKNCIQLKMTLWKETGFGQCIAASTLCDDAWVRNDNGFEKRSEIKLFGMLMEIYRYSNASPEYYIFLFDINQWYKAQKPKIISHFKVSSSYASFVKLSYNINHIDLNTYDETLRPFNYNYRINFEELYYPSSTYFGKKIIRFKLADIKQEMLDQLLLKNWSLLIYPKLIFNQCLLANLRPFFWDKSDNYLNYSLPDKVNFVVSILVENNIMSIFNACTEEYKNGTNGSSEAMLLLMQCLWNHFKLVKKYADQLCDSLFDCSDKIFCNKNERMLYNCLSQMLQILNFYESLHSIDDIQILNVDLVYQEKIMKSATQYLHALNYFLSLKLLPKQENSVCQTIQFDFNSLIQYSNKRRMDFGDLQLYLIDVVITNETNGYKSIELCQHECVKETKSLYPPSNVQSLLMVYLNTELLNTVKDFIIAYFLIDACYLQNLNETTTNLLRNVSYKNERLYKLCNASWFLDHDMFEDAMLIFASYNEWLIDDESWNWFHWSVMKLLVFKEQYYWAQYYLNLFKIKLISLDDHKFYVNLLIRNRNCFDALCYMHSRDTNEKNILFENIFEQCRNTNQLQRILNYPLDENEKVLFVSCLQKFDDTKSIHLKFLLQEQRYSEALEIHKSIAKTKNVCITTGLMNTFTNIPPINRRELNKKIYSDEETTKFWFMMGTNLINFKNTTPIRKNNKSFQINLIIPDVKYKDENIDKLEESDVILGEATDEMNLGELNITLRSEEHLQELDYVTLDETTDKNNSVKPVILNENEKKLDEHNFAILNKAADENNSVGSLILHESGKKLYEPDFVIVNEATDKNNSDKSDIAHDCEYKENLKEPNVIFSDGSEQSRGKLVSLIKNRKIENDNRVDLHNVKYLRDWLFNTLENPTPYFNSLTEEHHSNDNNQMWDGENENTLGNVIDDDKTSFIIKEDCCVTKALEENTAENSNIPFYFEEDIENCKDDLCDDPNKDYHDDEYTLFHNIFL